MESHNMTAMSHPTITPHDPDNHFYVEPHMYVITCIIISIGLPLTLLAIYSLYSQVKKDHVAPIFIINLLISDIIQFCYMIIEMAKPKGLIIFVISKYMYLFGLVTSVCFMVCIALERYLLIAWPLWYRFRSTIKISLVVCVVVWTLSLVVVFLVATASLLILFVPFPLFIFFLGGTLKALSAAISVPSDEKRRIVGILVLVLLIYTLLFLPTVLLFFIEDRTTIDKIHMLSFVLLRFSPLADLILYFFMRKGVIDKLLASLCCCRMDSDDNSRSSA